MNCALRQGLFVTACRAAIARTGVGAITLFRLFLYDLFPARACKSSFR
jgi:hypothetical protein